MPVPTVEQRLYKLRRRRDFLAERMRNQTGNPNYDRSEHFALSWAIRFLEDHYRPESPEVERHPLSPGRAASLDLQESEPGVTTKPTKLSGMVSCSRYRRESAR
jgi:hypothetical protein